jgi:hypothetical protein
VVVGAAVGIFTVAVASPPAWAGNAQMDGFVSKQADGGFVGRFVFNETGADQTVKKRASPSQTRKYYARFVNRMNTSEAFLTGSAGAECFGVKYFDNETGDNVTEEIVTTISFGSVSAGFKPDPLRVEIKAKGCATPGTTHVVTLDAAPSAGLDFDRVRAKLKVT